MARDLAVPSNSAVSTTAPASGDRLDGKSFGPPGQDSEFNAFINQIVEQARILTAANGSAIALRGYDVTICRARSGQSAPPLGAVVDITSGISKLCLDLGTPLYCADIASDRRVDPMIAQAVGTRAIAVVPIYSNGDVLGILEVLSRTPGVFTNQHLQTLEHLAALVGSAASAPNDDKVNDSDADARLDDIPDLALLVEWEPVYRVFLGSLVAVFSPRPVPTRRVRGWTDVLITPHVPWKGFFESILLHVVTVALIFGLSRIWPRELTMPRRSMRDVHITYYPASQSSPATNSTSLTARDRRQQTPARPDVLKVARERVAPGAGDGQNNHVLVAPAPAILSKLLGGLKKPVFGSSASVLPAAPDVGGSSARTTNLPTVSVVAPPPDLTGGPGSRRIDSLGTAIVPPSPDVQGSIASAGLRNANRLGTNSVGTADPSIVPPPPSMSNHAQLTLGAARSGSQTGIGVIGPPPTVDARGQLNARGNSASSGGGASQVIPPPPSTEGAGISMGTGRGSSLAAANSQVVPPAPSLQTGGNYGGSGRANSLTHGGVQVVPPPPSIQDGAGGTGPNGGSGTALGIGGPQVVPPSPSMGAAGGSGDGNSMAGRRAISPSLSGGERASPPATSQGAGTEPATGAVANNGASGSTESAPSAADQPKPTFQDLPLRLISAAFTPPRSSYFSNYEVFIAEKVGNKGETELIKLVYVFLPYQRRLTEYGFDYSKARKLRVIRDPSCDESLMQMEWPEGENGAPHPDDKAASNADRGNLLPCYRTTADDYRRAFSRGR